MSGEELLIVQSARSVRDGLQRQLNYMKWYSDEGFKKMLDSAKEKLERAPLTNSGCESEFAYLNNYVRTTSGNTSLQTVSERHITRRNRLFSDDKWKSKSYEEKVDAWKWAKNSPEAKQAHSI